MTMAVQVVCPRCGHRFTAGAPANRRAEPIRKARMAWSNKRGHYVRTMMSDPEWGQYNRRGSID